LPTPTRQVRIFDPREQRYVARVDLCWPDLGVFLELDGQQHEDQPVYDAVRQNLVVKLTRWHPMRLTWEQVTRWPASALSELRALLIPNCLVP
jgi:very-short-patch-repair endonuclease